MGTGANQRARVRLKVNYCRRADANIDDLASKGLLIDTVFSHDVRHRSFVRSRIKALTWLVVNYCDFAL